uniref:Fucolectin n=1 Tax=Magallana gigas TaxID=29159 RepID=K1PLX8_MAGGI
MLQGDVTVDENSYIYKEEETVNVAVSKPATLSSIYRPAYQNASNAVDNVINCPSGLVTAHTQEEFQPWLKIDLQALYDIKQVTIFNRQDNYGFRLHDVQVNVGNHEPENSCGFYKGPAVVGDRIVVYCASGAVGRYVLIKILSLPEQRDILTVCEVQVFTEAQQ